MDVFFRGFGVVLIVLVAFVASAISGKITRAMRERRQVDAFLRRKVLPRKGYVAAVVGKAILIGAIAGVLASISMFGPNPDADEGIVATSAMVVISLIVSFAFYTTYDDDSLDARMALREMYGRFE